MKIILLFFVFALVCITFSQSVTQSVSATVTSTSSTTTTISPSINPSYIEASRYLQPSYIQESRYLQPSYIQESRYLQPSFIESSRLPEPSIIQSSFLIEPSRSQTLTPQSNRSRSHSPIQEPSSSLCPSCLIEPSRTHQPSYPCYTEDGSRCTQIPTPDCDIVTVTKTVTITPTQKCRITVTRTVTITLTSSPRRSNPSEGQSSSYNPLTGGQKKRKRNNVRETSIASSIKNKIVSSLVMLFAFFY